MQTYTIEQLQELSTSELIRLYVPIKQKQEKFQNVKIDFFKEAYSRASDDDRQEYRKEMIDVISESYKKAKT